jgi:group II intron reverse transcriptase/maturase
MTALSIGGQTWSTKLARIGELSTKDRTLVFNNLGHIIDVEMLKSMFEQLDGRKAIGIDGVTKTKYAKHLDENLENLVRKIRRGTYCSKASRITEIPKEDGSVRPLAISCFEDKILQMAVSRILQTIYEPLFLSSSYGFRPGQNCHDALRALHDATFKHKDGAVVEIDIRKYFNSIPHGPLNEFLQRKINDSRFLRLIDIMIKAPTIRNANVEENNQGSPQGSILSPVLSNIYLHHVIDEWFQTIRKTHIKGEAEHIRYCDDMIFVFEHMIDAERFYKVLPLRLAKFGLEMHRDKSNLVPSGHLAAKRMHKEGKRIPTYQFLGFRCYWGLSRNGWLWRLKCKSRGDRFAAKLKSLRKYLKENLAENTEKVLCKVKSVVRGWMNYHAISDNEPCVSKFRILSKKALFWWINRKGGRRKMNWERFERLLLRIDYPKYRPTISMLYHQEGLARACYRERSAGNLHAAF